MESIDPIEFAKWFIHSRRKNIKHKDALNAVSFASSLMSELCANHPFEKEHRLIAEYKEYLKTENNVHQTIQHP